MYVFIYFHFYNQSEKYNIPVTSKLVKKIIINRDSSKVSGADFIPVMVLRKC